MKMNEISNISSEKKKLSVTVKNIIRTLTFCCSNIIFLSDVYGFLFRFRLGCRYRSDKGYQQ